MLAIGSIACKKNEATDPGTFTIEDSISSDTLVRSPLNSGYNKVPINISFTEKSGNGFSYSLAATYTNASITVDTDIFYNNGEITFSDDIYNTLTSDGYSNAKLTFTLTADNAGLNNPTIVKSYDIKLIKATVITNDDYAADKANLSNAIYNKIANSDKFYTNKGANDTVELVWNDSKFGINNNTINFTNKQNNYATGDFGANDIAQILSLIKTNERFDKYFDTNALSISFLSNQSSGSIAAFYKINLVPHLTNDMTNYSQYQLVLWGLTNQ